MGIHHLNNRVTHYVVGHGSAKRLRVSVPITVHTSTAWYKWWRALYNCTHEYGGGLLNGHKTDLKNGLKIYLLTSDDIKLTQRLVHLSSPKDRWRLDI